MHETPAEPASERQVRVNLIAGREGCVNRCIPDLFGGRYSSVLYVGANKKRQHFLNRFEESGYRRIVILEAHRENYGFLKEKFEAKNPDTYQVVWGKVQEIERFPLGRFDVVFFWHGPEHLQQHQISPTLEKLERVCNHLVVCGMPFGFYEQGPEYGNPFETHQSHIYPPFLEGLGYKTETLGNRDQMGANITAWKYARGAPATESA